MDATLSLVVNGKLKEQETRSVQMPRYLRHVRIQHESFMARCGRCEPAYVHVGRGASGRRAVVFNTGALSSVVSFSA